MNATVCRTNPARCDYDWQLAAMNDRLMDRAKYEAMGEDVDAVVASLQHWLIEHENCHPKRTECVKEVFMNDSITYSILP